MKIGIIQTRGLGDIVIAAPIAMYYVERGCQVYWPIDSDFIPSFRNSFPKINFIEIEKDTNGGETAEYFYYQPLKELTKLSCDAILCLYSHLTGFDFGQKRLQESLCFDAYKYAVAKVPFSEKWNFHPRRNPKQEGRLFDLLNLDPNEKYNVIQSVGSNFTADIDEFIENKRIRSIHIEPLTTNIFDWIGVLERAESLYLIDSVYANITEQLNLQVNKFFYLRSPIGLTPTMKSNWKFI